MSFKPLGPYPVGFRDFEFYTGTGPKDVTSTNHLVGRVFYPCKRCWTLPTFWTPYVNYARGYAAFAFFTATGVTKFVLKGLTSTLLYVLGITTRLPFYWGSELEDADASYPLIVYSPGLASNRTTYSVICSELASEGYVVVVVEHADGSAASVRLAGRLGWRLYSGIGREDEKWCAAVVYRVQELCNARHLMQQLNNGDTPAGFKLAGTKDAAAWFKGRLDMDRVAVAGHSMGGVTAAATAAANPEFKACVSYDPYWKPLAPSSPVISGWATVAPLLVIGSQDWNTPTPSGDLFCYKAHQDLVWQSVRPRRDAASGAPLGGGAVFIVPRGSSHHDFSDVPLLFGRRLGPIMTMLKIKQGSPQRMMHLIRWASVHFLALHLPPAPARATPPPPSQPGEVPHDAGSGLKQPLLQPEKRGGSGEDGPAHSTQAGSVPRPVQEEEVADYSQVYGDDAVTVRAFV